MRFGVYLLIALTGVPALGDEGKSLEQVLDGQPTAIGLAVLYCREEFRACTKADKKDCGEALDGCLSPLAEHLDEMPPKALAAGRSKKLRRPASLKAQ